MRLVNGARGAGFEPILTWCHSKNCEPAASPLVACLGPISIIIEQPTLSIKHFLDSLHLIERQLELLNGVVVVIHAFGLLVSWRP